MKPKSSNAFLSNQDCYDGSRPEEELSKDQKTAKLAEVPSLLEMCSHVFYLGSYFVGPQFTMTKFRGFIQRNIEDGGKKKMNQTIISISKAFPSLFSKIIECYKTSRFSLSQKSKRFF